MRKGFYMRLALSNLKKNRKIYVPYIITCICTIMMFYMIDAMANNTGLPSMNNGQYLTFVLGTGTLIVGFFAVIFMLYTNSFIIKRRRKEFGLFNILGMEKRHIGRILAYETLITATVTMGAGILIGMFLNKLSYMLLMKLLGYTGGLNYEISVPAILVTAALFATINVVTLLGNIRSIHMANPIELVRGGNVGEREPKIKWAIAILGVLTLGAGYWMSVTAKDPLSALALFFVAVALVIIGTYCLFTSGSIAVLKGLKKNKRYFYKKQHFTTVSGMIYRMKQNAVGLANICILSTMVLVMLSLTVCLYAGLNDVVNKVSPRDIQTSIADGTDYANNVLKSASSEAASKNGLKISNDVSFRYIDFTGLQRGDSILTDKDSIGSYGNVDLRSCDFITAADYAALSGDETALAENEVLLYANRVEYGYDTLNILGKSFVVKEKLSSFPKTGLDSVTIVPLYMIIVKDTKTLNELYELQKKAYGDMASDMQTVYAFDITGTDEQKIETYNEINDTLESVTTKMSRDISSCKAETHASFNELYGGLVFIGIFLGTLFIIATVLIIYYKQMSEGYDDRERFIIMRKVGMSGDEVKKTIKSQIVGVFYLPLTLAIIHTAFSFPMVSKLLTVFGLTSLGLFAVVSLIIAVVFAVLYAAVYSITAKAYYRIVSQ